MAYDILKTIPTDFPGLTHPTPDALVLTAQLEAVVSSAVLIGVIDNNPDYTLQYDVEPSAGDLTAIDAVCASHTGESFVTSVQKSFSEAVQTETGTTYQTKSSLTSGLLQGGEYLISWYCEMAVATADATSGVLARVLWDGTERAESSNNLAFYRSFSGSVIVDVAALASPVLTIQLKRVGTANTAQIRRMRMSIAPLQNVGG